MNQLFLQLAQTVSGNVITIVALELLLPGIMPGQFILL